MNREEIIKMAREAGAGAMKTWNMRKESDPITSYRFTEEAMERFAMLVAAKAAQDEREACASLDLTRCNITFSDAPFEVLQKYRGAIRARGQ